MCLSLNKDEFIIINQSLKFEIFPVTSMFNYCEIGVMQVISEAYFKNKLSKWNVNLYCTFEARYHLSLKIQLMQFICFSKIAVKIIGSKQNFEKENYKW